MPDNIVAPAATSKFATDNIGDVHYPRTKVTFGVDGIAIDVSTANPLPVELGGATLIALGTIELGVGTLSSLETVELGVASLAALENIQVTASLPNGASTAIKQDAIIAAIQGIGFSTTVALDGPTLAALETTELGAASLAALETTELGAATLAALETINTNDTLTAGTNRSGLSQVGDYVVMNANPIRIGGAFQNLSDTSMYLNMTGQAATAANGFLIPAGAGVNIVTNQAISVYCTASGKAYAAMEF